MRINCQTFIFMNTIETFRNYFTCEWIQLDNLELRIIEWISVFQRLWFTCDLWRSTNLYLIWLIWFWQWHSRYWPWAMFNGRHGTWQTSFRIHRRPATYRQTLWNWVVCVDRCDTSEGLARWRLVSCHVLDKRRPCFAHWNQCTTLCM